jgi:hypothetical protein
VPGSLFLALTFMWLPRFHLFIYKSLIPAYVQRLC